MAKLSRSALKGIVKECLMEILSEGLGPAPVLDESARKTAPSRRSPARNTSSRSHRSPVDTVSFNSAVEKAVNRATDDPVLSQILAETASTTLQEQISADDSNSSLSATGDAGIPLDTPGIDIFGSASQNWADLAFTDPKKT